MEGVSVVGIELKGSGSKATVGRTWVKEGGVVEGEAAEGIMCDSSFPKLDMKGGKAGKVKAKRS
jgi:hypothetical protein